MILIVVTAWSLYLITWAWIIRNCLLPLFSPKRLKRSDITPAAMSASAEAAAGLHCEPYFFTAEYTVSQRGWLGSGHALCRVAAHKHGFNV